MKVTGHLVQFNIYSCALALLNVSPKGGKQRYQMIIS